MKIRVDCIQNNNEEILHFSRPWSWPSFLKQNEKKEQITRIMTKILFFSLEDSLLLSPLILLTNRAVGICAVGTIIPIIISELGLGFFQKLGSKLSFISINVREK